MRVSVYTVVDGSGGSSHRMVAELWGKMVLSIRAEVTIFNPPMGGGTMQLHMFWCEPTAHP